MALPHGKIPIDILKEVVFKNLGAKRKEVALGPSVGIDAAVIDINDKSLIISMDPITGALERIGWEAVHVNANDIATFGVEPAFLFTCILLPEGADRKTVETLSSQLNEAASSLGIAIVGGHCEVTPELANPIVVGCTFGTTEKGNYITAAEAKAGDKIILTKSAGIEGTAILATDRQEQLKKALDSKALQNAKEFYKQISIVKDALTAYKTGGVHAMHDPTEGGIAGGIHEIADASKLGFKIWEEKIHIKPETRKICKYFGIDPLQLIASGSLLIAAKPDSAEKIIQTLRKNKIPAEIVGEFIAELQKRLIIRKNGKTENLVRPAADHLWQALEKTHK